MSVAVKSGATLPSGICAKAEVQAIMANRKSKRYFFIRSKQEGGSESEIKGEKYKSLADFILGKKYFAKMKKRRQFVMSI